MPTDLPPRVAARGAPAPVTFRTSDLFAVGIPLLFGVILLAPPARGHATEGGAFLAMAMAAVVMRLGPARARTEAARFVARVFPLVVVGFAYGRLNPVIDRVSPVLIDGRLAALDRWLFGEVPAVSLQALYHPALTELLFWCYTGFFVWQLGLLIVLYGRADRRPFERLLTTLVVFYLLSDVMYVLFPAIGPRFFLSDQFTVPLEGLAFADGLRTAFADNPMIRDCFPSGHTGLTLLVLWHAWRARARVYFWVMLPFAGLLIFSTLYCQFHYAIDLIFALPFCTGVLALQRTIERAMPGEVLVVQDPRTSPAPDLW